MEKKDLRIVYMGTPEFAVESLKRLVEGGYNVVAVITMPDKPMGRHGSVLQPSPVKQYAVEQGLKVLQPERLKDEGFVGELRALQADLQIVVAFRMLPEVVWAMPRLGTFNLHASLLPQYRGAAPINWAVMNGDTETGITTFFLKHEIDTGEIIDQVRVPIADTDNVGTVYDRLMRLGGDLVVKTVEAILAGTVTTVPQETLAPADGALRPAPKIFKETCRIDWNKGGGGGAGGGAGARPPPAAGSGPVARSCLRRQLTIGPENLRDEEGVRCPRTVGGHGRDRREDLPAGGGEGRVRPLTHPPAGRKETHGRQRLPARIPSSRHGLRAVSAHR